MLVLDMSNGTTTEYATAAEAGAQDEAPMTAPAPERELGLQPVAAKSTAEMPNSGK